MAQPLPYERDYDFQNFQSGHPSTPLPGDKVNAELDQVAATLDEVLARIALLQDDDTALKRGSVGYDQLAVGVSLGFEPPSAWLTATAYIVRDTVFQGAGFYQCLVSHTSGTFATDLAAGKWELLADFTSATADAEAAQAAAEAAQALAEAARDSATASASSASSNAASASASANSASADAEQTAADRIATAADRVATAADRVQTGLDVVSSAASAAAAAASAASIVIGPGGVQEYSENLAGVAAVSPTDGNFIVGNGTTWVAESGATARASLGLGSAAVASLLDEDDMASDSATAVPSQQSVKAYVDGTTTRFVETRTALKALDAANSQYAFLTEEGREGTFVWRSADLSALVAIDSAEAVWIASSADPTGVAGAWVRQRDNLDVLTSWAGAVRDGATDDSPAVQAALELAVATSSVLRVSPGKHRLTAKLAASFTATEITGIEGGGREISILYFDAADGGIEITYVPDGWWTRQSNKGNRVSISGLTISTSQDGGGSAVKIIGNHLEGRPPVVTSFSGLTLRGNTTATRWDIGIHLDKCSTTFTDNVHWVGKITSRLGVFFKVESDDAGYDPVNHKIVNVTATYCKNGFELGNHVEGMHITNTTVTYCEKGVEWIATAVESQLALTNSHVNCSIAAVDLGFVCDSQIIGNLFYTNLDGIRLADGGMNTIIGNTIRCVAAAPAGSVGIDVSTAGSWGAVWNNVIVGNYLRDFETGINPQAGTSDTVMGVNSFHGCTTNVANANVNGNFVGLDGSMAFRTLAQSSVSVSHTGDTNETALATITVPANAMGPNGRLRITALWSHTNSANNKTLRTRFSGAAGTQYQQTTVTTTAATRDSREIANRNSVTSQIGSHVGGTGGYGTSAGALATSAVDTTAATTIVLSGQLANASDTVALESYCVEVLYAA